MLLTISANRSLIRLFEAGILDRMTNDEYDQMFKTTKKSQAAENRGATKDVQMSEEVVLKKLNLRTLKGAFMVLLMGQGLSLVVFLFEKMDLDCGAICGRILKIWQGIKTMFRWILTVFREQIIRKLINLIMFKYQWN